MYIGTCTYVIMARAHFLKPGMTCPAPDHEAPAHPMRHLDASDAARCIKV